MAFSRLTVFSLIVLCTSYGVYASDINSFSSKRNLQASNLLDGLSGLNPIAALGTKGALAGLGGLNPLNGIGNIPNLSDLSVPQFKSLLDILSSRQGFPNLNGGGAIKNIVPNILDKTIENVEIDDNLRDLSNPVTALTLAFNAVPDFFSLYSSEVCDLSEVDPVCWIKSFSGQSGETWNTKEFDENKADAIVKSTVGPIGKAGITARLICSAAQTILPIVTYNSEITEDDDVLTVLLTAKNDCLLEE